MWEKEITKKFSTELLALEKQLIKNKDYYSRQSKEWKESPKGLAYKKFLENSTSVYEDLLQIQSGLKDND